MKTKLFFQSALCILIFILGGINRTEAQQAGLSQINVGKFKEKFEQKFCTSKMSRNTCKTRWENFSMLLESIKADNRITNIDMAAFIMATAYTETEIRNFSPATKEIKGSVNEQRDYWKKDNQTNQAYYGRGWVQITHKEMYQKATDKLKTDFINNPDLALEPANAYEILYASLVDGWLETYRSDKNGAAGTVPVKLTDFLDDKGNLDYALARAVINANCVNGCKGGTGRFEFKKDCFMPTAEHLDAAQKTHAIAVFFENAIRYSLPGQTGNPVLLPLITHGDLHAGCFIQDKADKVCTELTADPIYFNIDGKDESYEIIKDAKAYPKGYTEGYTNGKYKIFIKDKEVKKDGCLSYLKYTVLIEYKGQQFRSVFNGFCGC